MNMMLLKGFGCFVIITGISFSVLGKDIKNNSDPQKKDTIIATTEMVIAAAVSSPTGNAIIAANTKEQKVFETKVALASNTKAALQNAYGQLHPMSVSFVRAYQKRNETRLEKIKSKFDRQFTVIDNIMLHHDLPTDLKYLAIIESEMSNAAVSHKGAVGPWQFMATTGRLMGLTINKHRDDRRNLTKSTRAAAKYLKILYNQFDDWLLVIAAYNGGASRVESAIKKSHSRDFWKLQYYLPAESRAHVKKFVAARFILERKEMDVLPVLNMEKLTAENLNKTSVLQISGKYNIGVIAKSLDMELSEFNIYNPGFEKEVATNGYDMRLPKDKMEIFNAKREDILNESIEAILNLNKSIIAAGSKDNYPEAINLPKSKSIMSIGDKRSIERK